MLTDAEVEKLISLGIGVTEGMRMDVGGFLRAGMSNMPIVALNRNSLMPSDEEIARLLEYRTRVAVPYCRDIEQARETAKIEGYNTVVLIKGDWWSPNGPDGWAFRRLTWSQGPMFSPGRLNVPPPPHTLEQVLERA